jgi:hypothetical protein
MVHLFLGIALDRESVVKLTPAIIKLQITVRAEHVLYFSFHNACREHSLRHFRLRLRERQP